MESSKPYAVMIDDDRYWTLSYRQALKEHGVKVVYTDNVKDGLYAASDPEARVLVLDIMMPPGENYDPAEVEEGLSTGILVLRDLGASVKAGRLFVIVLTNRDLSAIQERIRIDLGFSEEEVQICHKMATSQELLAREVERLLSR